MHTPRGLPRFWLLILTALLFLAPVAIVVAESGSPEPGSTEDHSGEDTPDTEDHSGEDTPDTEDPDLDADEDDTAGDNEHDLPAAAGNASEHGNEGSDEDDEDGNETRGRSGEARDDDNESEDDEDDNETDDGDHEERARDTFRGHFQVADGQVSGEFVSFQLTDTGITGYAYGNSTIFDAIDYDPALGADEVHVEGSSFAVEGEGGQFRAVDNPTGHFRAESDDGTVTLRLASGYTAELLPRDSSGHDSQRAQITGPDNFTGYVNGDDEMTVDNGTITGDEDLRFTVHAPGRHGALSPKIDSAIANGTIGAEVVVEHGRTRGSAPTSVPVVNGDLNLTVEDAAGRVRVLVEGQGAGRALLFNIERDALGRAEDLVVVFDGAIIEHGDDLADVLDIQADEPAEYVLVVGRNATQIVVQVPHFSTHTVEIQGSTFAPITPVGSLAAFALAGGLAVAAVAASWTARNRQR